MKTKNETINYFIYARKSSESDDRQVQSIEDQINKLKEFASSRGLKVKEILTESKSAKTPYTRPVFAKMLERIQSGEAQGILCWQINRLSRNPIDSGSISWMLQEGVLKSIQTPEKEYSPEDNALILSVETGTSTQFIIDLKKNVKRGMDSKAEKGDYPTKPPLGYKNDRLGKKIMVDEERFSLIRQMWDLMLTGNYTPPKIVRIANEEWGFRTPRTNRGGDRPLAISTIYKMFNNIFYTGLFSWKGEDKQGNHKPMVTLEEYDIVQAILGKKGKPRMTKQNHAYTGEIRCEECGCLHTAVTKRKAIISTGKIESYTYYYCTRKTRRVTCSQKESLTVMQLEAQIDAELAKSEIHPRFLQWAIDYLNERNELEIEDRSKVYESQQNDYNRTQEELDNLTRMVYRGLITEEEFTRMRDELRMKLGRMKLALGATEQRASKWLELTQDVFKFATYSRARLNDSETTPDQKRTILRGLGWKFTMKNKILSISKYKWIEQLEEGYPGLKKKLDRLELDKSLTVARRVKQTELVRSDWCAYPDLNRN